MMKRTIPVLTGAILAAILLLSSPLYARMGGTGSGCFNRTIAATGCPCQTTNLTPEQQAAASAIEASYAGQLAEQQNALRTKINELILLTTNDQATLEEINRLRAELYLQRQEYQQLRIKINQEIESTLGTSYCACNLAECPGPEQCQTLGFNQACSTYAGSQNTDFAVGCGCRTCQ